MGVIGGRAIGPCVRDFVGQRAACSNSFHLCSRSLDHADRALEIRFRTKQGVESSAGRPNGDVETGVKSQKDLL